MRKAVKILVSAAVANLIVGGAVTEVVLWRFAQDQQSNLELLTGASAIPSSRARAAASCGSGGGCRPRAVRADAANHHQHELAGIHQLLSEISNMLDCTTR